MKHLIIWLVIIVYIMFLAVPVYAGNSVSVTYTPKTSGGISGFTITYVSDTDMHLSWNLGGGANRIMIRAKYGAYPNNIPNSNTAPTDGYLVYYGSGNNVDDTSMNFDNSPGTLYYSAWAQKVDNTWYTDMNSGFEESKEVILLSFIALIGILLVVNIMARNSFTPLKLMAALAWTIPLIWVVGYPPSFIVAGSNIQTGIIVIIIGLLLICGFNAFRSQTQMTKQYSNKYGATSISAERTGWHLPDILTPKTSYQNFRERRNANIEQYKDKVHTAVYGARRRDRDGRYID